MHTFHFDFNHLDDPKNHRMFLRIRGHYFPVEPHTPETLERARGSNSAAALLLKHRPDALTHFVSAAPDLFHRNSLTRISVVGEVDTNDPENHLPPLYFVTLVPHFEDYKRFHQQFLKKNGPQVPHLLHSYGLTALSANEDPWQQYEDAYHLKGPLDVAIHFSGQHPMVMNNKPDVFMAMQNDHIYPTHKTDPDSINQVNNVLQLKASIQKQGQPGTNSGFARVKQAVDGQGNKMQYGFNLGNRSAGDAVLFYDLTPETEQWLSPAAAQPVQSSRNDTQFQNQTYWVNQGQSGYDVSNQQEYVSKTRRSAAFAAAATGQWQVSPNTSTHGVTVDQSSIQYDLAANSFKVDVYNNFLRIVGAYVQFYSDIAMTTPISNPSGWKDRMPFFNSIGFQTDDKKYIDIIPNVDTIMGIPLPTDPTNLQLDWPTDAQAAKLMFGGMGTYNYDKNIVWPGFLETGVFQFGIPTIFMVAGAAITDTKWYKEFVKDTNNIAAAVGVGFAVGSGAFGAYSAVKGLKAGLITFGDILAGMLVSKGFEKLSEKIMEKIAEAELEDELPFVGIALRIAAVALDAAEMLVSLGEVLSSPAVIEVAVKRQMTFNFTLKPDPKHGEAGNPGSAIWPAVADHYRILVNYQNGTGFEAKGNVPLTAQGGSSNSPIINGFTVPWGGKMQIIAAVYSKSGWLCGKYQSDWMDAVPDISTPGVKNVSGNITEILVPLTMDTQYNFIQKIAYNDSNKHYWWGKSGGATAPVATVSDLNPGNVGNNLAQLTGITINESAYIIGYGWQGSGENIPLENDTAPDSGQMFVFQNLSVLSDPESRLKFSSFGFKTRPGIAFDIFGGTETQVGPLNFVLDTRNGAAGYLRRIDLTDNSNNYNLDSGKSYGTFTVGDVDGMVVHPNGYVVAVNWNAHRMQILQLPETETDDADAPAAVIVSNRGILEGLLLGPKALAISPDGKIYVLESLNQRVQSFDIKGNASPSFPGKSLFSISGGASLQPQLDQLQTPESLIQAFIQHDVSHLFDLDSSLATLLDAGVMTQDILDAFGANMVYLAFLTDSQGKILPDPKQTAFITVVEAGHSWTITDPGRNNVYVLLNGNGSISVRDQFNDTEIIVLQKGYSWQLKDLAGGRSYLMELNGSDLAVSEYLSYFDINPNKELLTYCDIAIESKGYVYVLAFNGDPNKGPIKNSDYVLDVYTPQGQHLFRTPDARLTAANQMEYVAAGKITLDIWRNLFSLNYEKIAGPGGRTEPSVSQWSPTPPLFDLDASNAAIFDSADMTKISPLFKQNGIALGAGASCTVVQAGEHWTIKDPANNKTYDAVICLSNIEVYAIPVNN